ncbi:glycosyltransferase family 2 protein, partial [Absicoccus porci]
MKVSIIMPVYNSEKYLEHAVNSILSQDFDDFELILVDDGSPDNSGQICDDFAKKDKRVKVIHK